jgi:hypothetical protein
LGQAFFTSISWVRDDFYTGECRKIKQSGHAALPPAASEFCAIRLPDMALRKD